MNLKLDWQHVALFATASLFLLGLVLVATTTKDAALASGLMSALVPAIGLWSTTIVSLVKGSTESTATAMLRASRTREPSVAELPPTKPALVVPPKDKP